MQFVSGEPEKQPGAPHENLIIGCRPAISNSVICCGEVALPDTIGSPDYAIRVDEMLAGYVELKVPGKGANRGGSY